MTIYYSAVAHGFFDGEINEHAIPVDAIAISDQVHRQLLDAQSAGKIISVDDTGYPVAMAPVRQVGDLAAAARVRRDSLLRSCDWMALHALETGGLVPQEWLEYRRALRGISEQAGFPQEILWPDAPDTYTQKGG